MKKIWSNEKISERSPYETPAVIYEGLISTRAGTTVLNGDGNIADPADLFGSD